MERNLFTSVATIEGNPKWENGTSRLTPIYTRESEIRTPFARDYTRILHSTAYRRLKHKTQVFFATTNDHVCTRIEHVNHVNSVSKTISLFLGLNSELTDAISIGHDLGHAPFGHMGEVTLKELITADVAGSTFWHEKNSLRFIDYIETLESPSGKHRNLDLTYAVRDGIVCHCGEVDENGLFPRAEFFNLHDINKANEFQPYTWEGCVVKISDKIAYLGRDIEDAMTFGLLENDQVEEIDKILHRHGIEESLKLNNTVLIHNFIIDLCKNSSPDRGITFSESKLRLMKEVKDFCYTHIYKHHKIERYKKFVDHLIKGLYGVLIEAAEDIAHATNRTEKYCPTLYKDFKLYLERYSTQFCSNNEFSEIIKIYDLSLPEDRIYACIDFISGMTDHYAIKKFKETIAF